MSTGTFIYDWVSSLPRPSLWEHPQISFDFTVICGVLIAKRKEDTRLAFFLFANEDGEELWLGDFDWEEEMEVPIFSLFSNIIQLIKFGLEQPLTSNSLLHALLNPQQNQPSSLQSSPGFPLIFDSAMFYLCFLYFPLQNTLSQNVSYFYSTTKYQNAFQKLLLAIGKQHRLPFCRFLGSCLSYYGFINENIPIHSYVVDDCKLWKIGIFSPIPLLKENKTHKVSQCPQKPTKNLHRILACQQLEWIIQLRHSVHVKANYITVEVGIDNVRCAVSPSEKFSEKLQPPEKLLSETERYFPSRVMISIVPLCESDDGMSLSVGQSSHNPAVQYSTANGLELSLQTPKDLGIKASSAISSTHTINYWQFDMPARGVSNAGCFEWILYDPPTQLQITSSKPPKRSIMSPHTWNKNRNKRACSPFNNIGGVVFAGDKYGQTLTWRMNKNSEGKILKWKIEGTIWLTYWPNEHGTSFYHTTSHNFSEEIELQLVQSQSE